MIEVEVVAYIGIVVVGAVLVVVAAVFVVKSASKKAITPDQSQPVKKIDAPDTSGERHPPALKSVLNKFKFPLRPGLVKFGWQRRGTRTAQQLSDKGFVADKQPSISVPDISAPAFEASAGSSYQAPGASDADLESENENRVNTGSEFPPEPDQQASDVEPESKVETEGSAPGTSIVETDQGISNTEPVSVEEPEVVMNSSLSAESSESTQDQSPEELEAIEYESEQTNGTSNDEHQEQRKIGDAVLDLFTTEVVEESDVSKLAETLDNVDVHDLLEEAQTMMNRFRGGRG